jgi:acyl-CoA thioesterase-1
MITSSLFPAAHKYATRGNRVPGCARYTVHVDVRRTFLVSFWLLFLGEPLFGADRPLLVCFGDSITAGYGLSAGESYPDALQRDLDKLSYPYKVANQGTSGATTKDAVAKVRSIVAMHPAIVVVEFGGNDGLRGLPLDQTRKNLDTVLTALEAAQVRVLLAGISLPPNYGPEYVHQFDQIFLDLAAKHRTAIVPMIYTDLIKVSGTIQPDGIHPTAKGSEILARTLLSALRPMLHKSL